MKEFELITIERNPKFSSDNNKETYLKMGLENDMEEKIWSLLI